MMASHHFPQKNWHYGLSIWAFVFLVVASLLPIITPVVASDSSSSTTMHSSSSSLLRLRRGTTSDAASTTTNSADLSTTTTTTPFATTTTTRRRLDSDSGTTTTFTKITDWTFKPLILECLSELGNDDGAGACDKMKYWDVSKVTDCSLLFWEALNPNTHDYQLSKGADLFNVDLSLWNTSSCTTMKSMFHGAHNFNQPIGNWNTERVTDMSHMFQGATNFNQDISRWNTGSVTNMAHMFRYATNFHNDRLQWDTSKVQHFSYMFLDTNAFNGYINDWDITSANDEHKGGGGASNSFGMVAMFDGAKAFNQPLDLWDVSRIRKFSFLFQSAVIFNQDLSSWNIGNGIDFTGMFHGARSFNQTLCWSINMTSTSSSSDNNKLIRKDKVFEGTLVEDLEIILVDDDAADDHENDAADHAIRTCRMKKQKQQQQQHQNENNQNPPVSSSSSLSPPPPPPPPPSPHPSLPQSNNNNNNNPAGGSSGGGTLPPLTPPLPPPSHPELITAAEAVKATRSSASSSSASSSNNNNNNNNNDSPNKVDEEHSDTNDGYDDKNESKEIRWELVAIAIGAMAMIVLSVRLMRIKSDERNTPSAFVTEKQEQYFDKADEDRFEDEAYSEDDEEEDEDDDYDYSVKHHHDEEKAIEALMQIEEAAGLKLSYSDRSGGRLDGSGSSRRGMGGSSSSSGDSRTRTGGDAAATTTTPKRRMRESMKRMRSLKRNVGSSSRVAAAATATDFLDNYSSRGDIVFDNLDGRQTLWGSDSHELGDGPNLLLQDGGGARGSSSSPEEMPLEDAVVAMEAMMRAEAEQRQMRRTNNFLKQVNGEISFDGDGAGEPTAIWRSASSHELGGQNLFQTYQDTGEQLQLQQQHQDMPLEDAVLAMETLIRAEAGGDQEMIQLGGGPRGSIPDPFTSQGATTSTNVEAMEDMTPRGGQDLLQTLSQDSEQGQESQRKEATVAFIMGDYYDDSISDDED